MEFSSHRLRAQERNMTKKLAWTVAILIGGALFAVFVGLPIMAKLAVALSLIKKEDAQNTQNTSVSVFAPVLEPLPEATNSASIAVYGLSDRDRTIVLSVNGEKREAPTDDEGRFNFRGVDLKEGNNTISVKAKKGTSESESVIAEIVYKKEPPKLEILEPSDGQRFLSDGKVTIKGQTDPDNTVSVNERFVIVDRDGNFSYQVSLSEGENVFKFKATDEAGNFTDKEFKLHFSP